MELKREREVLVYRAGAIFRNFKNWGADEYESMSLLLGLSESNNKSCEVMKVFLEMYKKLASSISGKNI